MSRSYKDTKLRETRKTARKQRREETGIEDGWPPKTSEQAEEDDYYSKLYQTLPGYQKLENRHSAAHRHSATNTHKRCDRRNKHANNRDAMIDALED